MKSQQRNSHQLRVFLAFVPLCFSLLSCSSGGKAAKDKGVGEKNPTAGIPQDNSDAVPDEGPFRSWKYEWDSDVSDVKLKPCPAGKPFANGKCWDEVHFSKESLSLKNPDETFTFLEAGKTLTPFILEHYVFSNDDGNDFILLNERLAVISSKTGLWARYWFLPTQIRVSRTSDKNDLSKAVFLAAEFPLSMSYGSTKTDQLGLPESVYFRGSLFICGKTLPLPLIMKSLDSACEAEMNRNDDFLSAYGSASFGVESLKTTLAERRAYSIEIGNINGLRW